MIGSWLTRNCESWCVPLILFVVCTATASAEPPAAGKPKDRVTKPSTAADNSTYSGQQVEIREVTLTDSGKVQITFNTMPETLYYCPGANGETTDEGTLLTFVRSFVKAKPRVDYPAKRKGDPAKTWDKLILVDAQDKRIFVNSGKALVKIFPADMSAAVGAAIVIEARFTATSGDDTDLLSAPKVTTRTGQKASIKAVTERHCPNDEIVEEGVILNVTPTVEHGVVTLKGSAIIVNSVVPDGKEIEKDVRWIGFSQLKTTFFVVAQDPKKQYRLGPIEMNGKKYEIWLSSCEVAE